MQELARFLAEERDAIIETVADLAVERGLELRHRFGIRLDELAAAVDAGDAAAAVFDTAIASHGRVNAVAVKLVVGEYQVLRRAMLDVYTRPGAQPCLSDLLLLNDVVDLGISTWIDHLTGQRGSLAVIGDPVRERLGLPLEPRHIDLQAVVRVTLDELSATHRGRWIELKESAAGADFEAVADRMRLVQAMKNVVDNAVENYADPIVVGCIDEGMSVRIDVTSAGSLGVEVANQVFEPFAPAGIRNGPGQGLFLVAEIARAHGGGAWMTAFDTRVQVSFRIAKQVGS